MAQTTSIEPNNGSKGASTVAVFCKLPSGIILQLSKEREENEPSPSGPRPYKIWRKTGPQYTIKGAARFRGLGAIPGLADLTYGCSVTPGIPADFWEKWLAQNQDSDAVQNHLIFAHASGDYAASQAREHERERTGLEPIDPDTLNRVGNHVHTADAQKSRGA